MKKVLAMICMILMVVALAGCSQQASGQKSEEELRVEIKGEMEAEVQKGDQPEVNSQEDSSSSSTQTASVAKDDGRIEVASFAGGKDFELLVETDKSKEVVKGVPVYYLSMKYPNGEKKLLSRSVDRGDDWTNSIAEIIKPTLSNDGTKVYYSTDNTFTRSSGYGANNYRTRVLNLKTFQDSYFEEGALITILNSSHGSYANHVVLELNSLDSAGEPTMVYQVVTPTGDQLVVLESAGNWQAAIEAKLNPPQQSTPPANQTPTSDDQPEFRAGEEEPENLKLSGFRNETINRTQINYSDYRVVVVPMYDGLNTLHWVNQDIGSVTQGPQGMEVNFAIFGHLNDIKITYYQGMEDPGETINVGTLYNAHVGVRVWLPNGDMSHIGVTGVADLGNGDLRNVSFGLDDMRETSDYEVIMFK